MQAKHSKMRIELFCLKNLHLTEDKFMELRLLVDDFCKGIVEDDVTEIIPHRPLFACIREKVIRNGKSRFQTYFKNRESVADRIKLNPVQEVRPKNNQNNPITVEDDDDEEDAKNDKEEHFTTNNSKRPRDRDFKFNITEKAFIPYKITKKDYLKVIENSTFLPKNEIAWKHLGMESPYHPPPFLDKIKKYGLPHEWREKNIKYPGINDYLNENYPRKSWLFHGMNPKWLPENREVNEREMRAEKERQERVYLESKKADDEYIKSFMRHKVPSTDIQIVKT